MLPRFSFLLIMLLLSSCASKQLVQTEEEFDNVKNKASVKVHLKAADAHYAELKSLQAHTLFPKEFNKLTQEFSLLISLLDTKEVPAAIEQEPELIKKMLQLEIQTLKKIHLGEAIDYIQKAKKLDATDYAPSSLDQTQKLLNSTQKLIDKSYRNRSAISEQGKETLQSAKKLYFISKEASSIHASSDKILEQKIISDYDFLAELESTLKLSPVDTQDYANQRTEVLKQIQSMAITTNKPQIPRVQPAIVEPKKPEVRSVQPSSIISHETNKAVLPELLLPRDYSEKDEHDEENLQFDDIEIVK